VVTAHVVENLACCIKLVAFYVYEFHKPSRAPHMHLIAYLYFY